ncbi:hypothetical protein AGMMS50276_14810 [Synergistales bacterium]|nr:hypothetical protein AGMMS50276_14810 [Synergistales bacterium]
MKSYICRHSHQLVNALVLSLSAMEKYIIKKWGNSNTLKYIMIAKKIDCFIIKLENLERG